MSSKAVEVLEKRFPAGEKVIASDLEFAYHYASDVIQGRWPEGEAAIASDPGYAIAYARKHRLHYDEKNKRFVER